MKRKHISWKTRCASALLQAGHIPYGDAKIMTEDQFLSLFHWDHNILHSSGHLDADKYWNLAPMLIRAHRTKTKTDAKIIAKSKRIRKKSELHRAVDELVRQVSPHVRSIAVRKLRSRGFDKTLRKRMDGKVVKR